MLLVFFCVFFLLSIFSTSSPIVFTGVSVECLGIRFDYGFEYLGPTDSMVYTPATDRYIVSSLLSLKQFHVACFYGGSGTGKTRVMMEVGKVSKIIKIILIKSNCIVILLNFSSNNYFQAEIFIKKRNLILL